MHQTLWGMNVRRSDDPLFGFIGMRNPLSAAAALLPPLLCDEVANGLQIGMLGVVRDSPGPAADCYLGWVERDGEVLLAGLRNGPILVLSAAGEPEAVDLLAADVYRAQPALPRWMAARGCRAICGGVEAARRQRRQACQAAAVPRLAGTPCGARGLGHTDSRDRPGQA